MSIKPIGNEKKSKIYPQSYLRKKTQKSENKAQYNRTQTHNRVNDILRMNVSAHLTDT